MQAFSVEKTIVEGENQVQALFKFVVKMIDKLEAYEMEKAIFARLMKIEMENGVIHSRLWRALAGEWHLAKYAVLSAERLCSSVFHILLRRPIPKNSTPRVLLTSCPVNSWNSSSGAGDPYAVGI